MFKFTIPMRSPLQLWNRGVCFRVKKFKPERYIVHVYRKCMHVPSSGVH